MFGQTKAKNARENEYIHFEFETKKGQKCFRKWNEYKHFLHLKMELYQEQHGNILQILCWDFLHRPDKLKTLLDIGEQFLVFKCLLYVLVIKATQSLVLSCHLHIIRDTRYIGNLDNIFLADHWLFELDRLFCMMLVMPFVSFAKKMLWKPSNSSCCSTSSSSCIITSVRDKEDFTWSAKNFSYFSAFSPFSWQSATFHLAWN